MEISRLGEFALIERIRRVVPENRKVMIGIGDDAACVFNQSQNSLITTDILIEGVDFKLDWMSLFDLGYKSLAVNLSDIAAMGGVPDFFLLGLGIPPRFTSKQIDEFYRGIASLAEETKVVLVGGDLSGARDFTISACILGHAPHGPITRRGAHRGDDIYVTGTLGDSALGLWLLERRQRPRSGSHEFLISRHRRPAPRLAAGLLLAREKLATAMIDISDGLLQDLDHIASQSKIGAEIWASELPLSPAYRAMMAKVGLDVAVSGGEDYELLFCALPENRERIYGLEKELHVPVKRIGSCLAAEQRVRVIDASGKPLTIRSRGYNHFKPGTRANKKRKVRGRTAV
jgi:thiamine-monophosphate kinase